MARLNIEDQFWTDILPLVAIKGDFEKAIGHAVYFIKVAQEHYKQGKSLTEEDFKNYGFSDALIPVFAKRTANGIEAKGSEKHFGWLEQKAESGRTGGRISAQRQRDKNGRLVKKESASSNISGLEENNPSTHQADSKHSQADTKQTPSKTKHSQASISISISSSKENTREEVPNKNLEQNKSQESAPQQTLFGQKEKRERLRVEKISQEPILERYGDHITREIYGGWLASYEDEDWVIFELKKAATFILADPRKAPKKNFARFFSSWLSRSWEWKRKNNVIDLSQRPGSGFYTGGGFDV